MRLKGFLKSGFFCKRFKIFLLLVMILFLIGFAPELSFAQRGLGFKGLVPPAKAKPKKFSIKVDELDLPIIRAINEEGDFVKAFLGPYYFFRERGFDVYKGQMLKVLAVPMTVEGSRVLVCFELTDKDTKQRLVLRNSKGEPVWWGSGGRPNEQKGRQKRGAD